MKQFLIGATIASLLATSCKKEEPTQLMPSTPAQEVSLTPIQLDKSRTEFAKILAKGMANENVRALLKKEASKQFDLDYDVLFQIVKDTEVTPGLSFSNYLSSLADSKEEYQKIINSLPLLTIYVPELEKFSLENWDASTQVPLVAVVNSDHDELKHRTLITFDHLGNQTELQSNIHPTAPVIVVKENERVAVLNKSGRYSYDMVPKGSLIVAKEGKSFYFLDDVYNKSKDDKLKSARTPFAARIDQRLKDASNLGAASQRDYVYYNILNATDQGILNTNYAEHLTSISFTTKDNMTSTINDEKLGDWTDGMFEFQLEILFFNGTSGLKNDFKVFSVHNSKLIASDGSLRHYEFTTPIRIATWDYRTMGDTWKIIVQEMDPASTRTITVESSSKFSFNFETKIEFGKPEVFKIGIGAGASQEQSYSSTISYQTTQASDNLGSMIIPFKQPVIVERTLNPLGSYTYRIIDLDSGTIFLNMEPRLIQ